MAARSIAILAWTGAALFSDEPKSKGPAPTEPLVWRERYADGLRAALENRRAFIVYLPPANGREEPPSVLRLPQKLGVPPLVEGVRASSDEVLELLARLRVKKLPALVLLDRRENILAGWEDGVPADVFQRLQAALKKSEDRDAKDAKTFQEARRTAASTGLEAAYRKALPLIESRLTSPENLKEARAMEADLLTELRRSAVRALALEGLRADAEVLRALEAVRASTAHAGFQKSIDREIARLRGTSPAAAAAEPARRQGSAKE